MSAEAGKGSRKLLQQVSNIVQMARSDVRAEDAGIFRAEGVYARIGKRALDIALILVVVPVALTLVGLFALLARLDGGPAFYGQARVGRGGRLFTCWKIRTMVPDADARLAGHLAANPEARAEWDECQKLRDDPRVTAFGRLLRATSLDELPQLWNVFIGEMSLVGPRPFTPDQTSLYVGRCYYKLRPGLTGYWQVGGRNDVSFAARAIDDSRYAREMSLAVDLGVIVRTIGVVLSRKGC